MSAEHPGGRPRRRAVVLLVAVAAAFVLVYGTVVALYAVNDQAITVRGCTEDPPTDAVQYALSPQAVDAVGDRITATLTVRGIGPVESADSGLFADPVTIVVTDTEGDPTHEIGADEIPSPISLRFLSEGQVERWPFDTHVAEFAIVTLRTTADGPREVPTSLCGSVHVPGWTFSSEDIPGTDDVVVDGEPVPKIRITAARSGATVAFGIVLLSLMVAMPVLVLIVAITVWRGKRKVEASFMSWMGAMLFATIPLRTFLPGSPPIGSWVDFLVVLWVIAALIAGLAIYVAAWFRWSRPVPTASAQPPA